MATNTEKLNLKKPSQNDFYNVDDFNDNFQKIDDFADSISKTTYIENVDVLTIAEDGWYYGASSKNVPSAVTYGYIRVMCRNESNRVVYWRPHNSNIEYVNVLSESNWLGWSEIFTNKGGTLKENLSIYKSEYPQFSVGHGATDRSVITHYNNMMNVGCIVNGQQSTLALSSDGKFSLWASDGNEYKIHNDRNKPSGSYIGNGANRQIQIGGIGKALVVYNETTVALVTPYICFVSKYNTSTGGSTEHSNYGAKYDNGTLTLQNSLQDVNASGVTYYYQVL